MPERTTSPAAEPFRPGDSAPIISVGVVGLGTMGAGIAEVFARAGISVLASEVDAAAVERGRTVLTGSLDRAVARGRLASTGRDEALARVEFTTGLERLAGADLVIEVAPERLDLKRQIFTELDAICRPDAVLATNTSSLPVVEIAAATSHPYRVLGMHFFNPAPVMRLVEVVRGIETDPRVAATVAALCTRLGKVPVVVGDRAGFIANALLFGYLNNAAGLYESGYATREDIDAAMRHGAGLPMGPLTLMDLIGLDVTVGILDTMYRRGGRDRRHAAVPLLRQLVAAGLLGRKTGRGFYTYQAPGSGVVVPERPAVPAAEDVVAARPLPSIAVVGAGPLAAGLVARLGAVAVPDLSDPVSAERLAGVDLVVEATEGATGQRLALFAELGRLCRPGVVLATAGPGPVIDIAMASGRPDDVVGLHLTGPAQPGAGQPAKTGQRPESGQPVGPGALVEIVRTVRTSPTALATVAAVVEAAGLASVRCADRAGFLVDALLLPHLNDAVRMLESGYASVADIDHAMTLGCGYPVGPFVMIDRMGLDVVLAGQREIFRALREPGLAPAPLLEQLVAAGRRGGEGGSGFAGYGQ